MLYVTSVFLNLLRFILWASKWSILQNVAGILDKNLYSALLTLCGCYNKLPHTLWLRASKIYISLQLWRPEVKVSSTGPNSRYCQIHAPSGDARENHSWTLCPDCILGLWLPNSNICHCGHVQIWKCLSFCLLLPWIAPFSLTFWTHLSFSF